MAQKPQIETEVIDNVLSLRLAEMFQDISQVDGHRTGLQHRQDVNVNVERCLRVDMVHKAVVRIS